MLRRKQSRRTVWRATGIGVLLLIALVVFRDDLFGGFFVAAWLVVLQPLILVLLVPVAITLALLFRFDPETLLAFRSPTHRDFVVRSLALVSLGMMVGLASMNSVALHTRSECVRLVYFCEPIRAEGRHYGRGWPVPWIAYGVVDDYDRAQAVDGFTLDVLLWFWMVSIPQAVGSLAWRGIHVLRRSRLDGNRAHGDPS